jgi:hypothetical protein
MASSHSPSCSPCSVLTRPHLLKPTHALPVIVVAFVGRHDSAPTKAVSQSIKRTKSAIDTLASHLGSSPAHRRLRRSCRLSSSTARLALMTFAPAPVRENVLFAWALRIPVSTSRTVPPVSTKTAHPPSRVKGSPKRNAGQHPPALDRLSTAAGDDYYRAKADLGDQVRAETVRRSNTANAACLSSRNGAWSLERHRLTRWH